MAYTSIDDPTKYFNIKTYTGNLLERAVEGLGHQPDFLWFKNLDTTNSHNILDSLRGVTKKLEGTNNTNAEGDTSTRLTSFDSDGFTVKTDPSVNGQTNQMCVWSWACNAGTNESAVAESGNNPGNTRQTNTTAGFSMITYTGTGSAGTIAHGLGEEPKLIIFKDRSEASAWVVYHKTLDNTNFVKLNDTTASASESSNFNNTSPTSSVFTVGTSTNVNKDGNNYIAYCFAEKKGYSSFGSYKGNAADNGAFVYTGFKPRLVIIKNITDTADWTIWDTTRYPKNVQNIQLYPNLNNAEDSASSTTRLDMLSNGFKMRGVNNKINGNGDTMLYMAWAENPLVTGTGTPATAR